MPSKLFMVLSSLKSEEWLELEKFILIRTKEFSDTFKLYKFLSKERAKIFEWDNVQHIKIQLFPEMKRKAFLNIQSRLFVICEKWLVHKYFESRMVERELTLVKIYNDRSLFKLADLSMKKLERSFASSDEFHLEKEYYRFKLYYEQYFSHNPIKNDSSTQLLLDAANSFMLYAKDIALFLEIEMNNSAIISHYDFNHVFEELKNLQAYSNNTKNQLILQKLLLFVKAKDKDAFNLIYHNLLADKFDDNSLLQIIVFYYLFNYTQKFRFGEEEGYQEIANKLIEFGMERKIFLNGGKLSNATFQRLLSIHLKYKSFEETDNFIKNLCDFLEDQQKQDMFTYADSLNHFYHDKHDQVLQNLQKISSRRYDLKITILLYEIFIMYKDSTIDEDVFLSRINNYERSIKRNKEKISSNLFKGVLNAFKLVKKMNKGKYDNVEIDIKDYKPLAGSLWFSKELQENKKVG